MKINLILLACVLALTGCASSYSVPTPLEATRTQAVLVVGVIPLSKSGDVSYDATPGLWGAVANAINAVKLTSQLASNKLKIVYMYPQKTLLNEKPVCLKSYALVDSLAEAIQPGQKIRFKESDGKILLVREQTSDGAYAMANTEDYCYSDLKKALASSSPVSSTSESGTVPIYSAKP